MTDRRTFIKEAGVLSLSTVGLSVLGCASPSPGEATEAKRASSAEAPASDVLDTLGVQLYTLRSLMDSKESVDATLGNVSDIGYELVETAGLYGLSAQTMRGLFDAHGLKSPAGHYGLEMLQKEFGGTVETAHTLGQHYVVAPWIAESNRGTADAYRAIAEEFNRLGARLQDEGLQFAYHNHNFEFETFGGGTSGEGTTGYDLLLQHTDPALVDFEMDIYWTYKSGRDPLAYFERYPGRFKLSHLKGGTAPPERKMVSVGEGAIDYAAILRHADQAGMEHAFVEHDRPQDPLASIRTSYQHLKQLSVKGDQ